METLQAELETIDMRLCREPPNTRSSVRHHLIALIARHGKTQAGPYQLSDLTTALPSVISTHSTAVSCVMDALRNDLDLDRTPAIYTVAPHPVLVKLHVACNNLDQIIEHDLSPDDDPKAT